MSTPAPENPTDQQATREFGPAAVNGTTRVFDPADPNAVTHSIAGGPSPSPGPPPEGVPGYTIVRELGRGGMGVVYLAKQSGLNRDVALKMVLSGGHASASERIRFLAEAEAIATVQHPGIVQVFDFGTHSGQPFFALEYLSGGSLADSLQQTLPEPRAAAVLLEKLSRAIQAAHDKGIIHRDLKPTNILLSADGSPKVTDFGLARKSESGSGLTQTGAILGTPSYMSPEQASGQHAQTGPGTDVYSLGAILYECLTGRPPFRAATAVDTVMQVVSEEPVPPGRLVPNIPRDLETICLKCLQKDPAKRYLSAKDLADDLGRFTAGDSILARPVPVWEKGWRWARKHPSYFIAAGFMIGSVVASIVLLASKNASLTVERNAARRAEAAASAATVEADEQRKKASDRLERAVTAVEQVMMRVAGEKWAIRPELQQERREVLEEAVNFFSGLGADESRDPIVRKQAARANLFAATAYISLADYTKCRQSCIVARELFQGLQAEFPTDSAHLRGEAEVVSLLGHADAISAQFSSALQHYETVLKLCERAITVDSTLIDNQLALADAYQSLALFYSFQRPELSRTYHQNSLAIGEKLCAEPAPGFKPRLVTATALTNLAVSEFTSNPAAARKKLDTAQKQVDVLDRMTPPTARAAESFLSTKAGLAVYRGLMMFRHERNDAGIEVMKSGIDVIAQTLKVQPNSFPLRIQHVQFRIILADALLSRMQVAEAQRIMDEVSREQAKLIREQPQLTWVESLGQVQRSNAVIHRMREHFSKSFESESHDILEKSNNNPSVRYNVACAYAQAVEYGPAEERERYAVEAVRYLTDLLKNTDYFRNSSNVRHIDADTDLDPIRGRADFREFLRKARESARILESAPPPRKVELK